MEQVECELLQVLAYFFLRNARPEKSVALLDAMAALQPANLDVQRSLALAQIRAGQGEDALANLDKLAACGADDEYFHLMRSEALSLVQRHDDAAAAMRAYLALKKPNARTPRKEI